MSPAEAAAALWGGVPKRLLGSRENEVREIALLGGERAVLRLHRPGYQNDAGIRAELAFVAALAGRGLPVAAPVALPDGALFAVLPDGRRASVVRWVEGKPLGRSRLSLPGTAAEQVSRFRALGALLARLHAESDALVLPVPFARPAWDVEGCTGEAPVWGRFWEHPEATDAEAATLRAAREALRARLTRWRAEGMDFGPIHADVLRENVLVHRGALSLIDFDDCGTGFRHYDLGTALVQNLTEPAYPLLRDALCRGYGDADPEVVEWFVLVRACASVGWTMPRLAPDDPVHRSHIARATGLAERLM